MLINYTCEKANKVFTLWLSKALLCPKRKGAMQQLWLRMEARQIAPAFNPERIVQYFTLVFKGFTSSCNSSGNKGSQTTYFACFNLCKKQFSERRDCHYFWLNMYGNKIIEMIVLIYRKNSFFNNLGGAMFSGSFTTLP